MEIHDSQRLVEVFHLQRVRTETAHLEVLIIATDNRRKSKIFGQFLIEFGAFLLIVAIDFMEAEEGGHHRAATRKDE